PGVTALGGGEKATAVVPVRLRELAVGSAILQNPTVYALALPGLAAAHGSVVDGVLGYDFLSRYVVEIDYVARQLTLHPPEGYRYPGTGETLPFTLEQNLIQIPAEILRPGRELLRGKFTVDAGMSSAVFLNTPFVNEHRLLEGVDASAKVPLGVGVGGEMSG